MTQVPRVDMPPMAKIGMTELAKAAGVPVRTLYRMKANRPSMLRLLEDGVRYRRLKEMLK